jgi:HEPN domain-containing protein
LALARTGRTDRDVLDEDLCFEAQQAAEKALKALLVAGQVPFPRTHDIAALITLVQKGGREIPDTVRAAAVLTQYATEARYPAMSPGVTPDEHATAVRLAQAVVAWVEGILGADRGSERPR